MHASVSLRGLFCAVLLFMAAARADAAIYAVGSEAGCTHATIQEAIDAAEANPGEDFIRVPHSQVWNEQALVIDTAQTLWLEGFWSDCNNIDGSTRTTLDGFGGSAAPVLRIQAAAGSVIGFDMLTIRNGDVSGESGKGGGVYYRGNGVLVISNSSIINSVAGLGGGMYLEGTGEAAAVYILGGVGITGNVAVDSGGGVFAEAVHLYMVDANSIIAFNEATGYEFFGVTVGGYGGGLVVNSTTSLDGFATIGSAGVGSLGAISGNSARYGGGVAVLGETGSYRSSYLYLHATQSGVPAKIDQNFASVGGGGIYARGHVDGGDEFSEADAILWNASIEGNAAAQGSALFIDDAGAFFLNGHFVDEPPADVVPCSSDVPCGRIVGNIDQDALGQPTGGAVIHAIGQLVLGGIFDETDPPTAPRGTVIEGNRGGRLFDLQDAWLDAFSLLISGNEISGQLIRSTTEDGRFNLLDTTIAGNTIGGDAVLEVDDAADLRRVLIWQPGTTSWSGDGTPSVQWSIVSEAESLGGGPGAIVADPRFIDPARGDYRLRAASPAIDYAPPITGDDRDVFGLPRDQDIGVVPGVEGYVRDIGAHERPALQPVVLNGDFAIDLNLWWPEPALGWSGENAPGSAGGSAQVALDGVGAGASVIGASQCIHVPGPGTWLLNGSGRAAAASSPSGTDYVELHWEYRRDGGEACTDGAADVTGSHIIGSIGDNWTSPDQPAQILVSGGEWNHNSSITVKLAIRDSASTPANVNGWFDDITLEWSADGSDVIFEDGFEGL